MEIRHSKQSQFCTQKIDVLLELMLKQLHEQIIHWKPQNTISLT